MASRDHGAEAGRGGKPAQRRPRGQLRIERGFWNRGILRVAGVDEVGRGPLAGPVVAAAVIFPRDCVIEGADDSKKLTAARREELFPVILERAICVRLGAASSKEIDRLNILRATGLAMKRAVAGLDPAPDHLLVDGLPMPELGLDRQTAVIDGDAKVHAIACASIVAKVCRDRLMSRLALRYPRYGWQTNMGYSTPEHREALLLHGPTPHHRQSFQPIQLALELKAT